MGGDTGLSRHPVKTHSRVIMLPTRVLDLPYSIEIDQRPGKKFRQGFIGVPAAAGGSENK